MVAGTDRETQMLAWRALSLESCSNVNRIAMKVSSIGNRVADVNSNAKSDGAVRKLISVMERDPLLHLHCTTHRTVDAVEHNQQRIAPSLDNPAHHAPLSPGLSGCGAEKSAAYFRRIAPASSNPISRLYPTISA